MTRIITTSLLLLLTLACPALARPLPRDARQTAAPSTLAERAKWGVLAAPGMSLGTFARLRVKSVVPLIQQMHARNKRAFEVDSRCVPKTALAVPYGVLTIVGVAGNAALAGYDILAETVRGLTGTSRRGLP